MLVPNVKRKNLLKGRVSESFFEKKGGKKLMACHLFLDNFLKFVTFWVVFKG
jgi:hypothetical protein